MPLHGGTDIMMSNEDYEKFYWPSLYRVMEEIINQGMVPYVFLEGPYNTRLEILKQVPKGKVIYMFEQVDIAKAKDPGRYRLHLRKSSLRGSDLRKERRYH